MALGSLASGVGSKFHRLGINSDIFDAFDALASLICLMVKYNWL